MVSTLSDKKDVAQSERLDTANPFGSSSIAGNRFMPDMNMACLNGQDDFFYL